MRSFYEGRGETQKQAQATLNQVGGGALRGRWDADHAQFKENPDSWLLVDQILSEAQYPQTKCELPRYRCLGATLMDDRFGPTGA